MTRKFGNADVAGHWPSTQQEPAAMTSNLPVISYEELAAALRAMMAYVGTLKVPRDTFGRMNRISGLAPAHKAIAALDAHENKPPVPRVCIKLEGGVIQNVFSDTGAKIYVLDYDVEDAAPPEGFEDEDHAVCQLEQDDGDSAECVLQRYEADIVPVWFGRMDASLAARAVELDAELEESARFGNLPPCARQPRFATAGVAG
jgi:hypothetical protein